MSSLSDLICSPVVYGLPRSHWHCRLDNFDWTGQEQLEVAVWHFWQAFLERPPPPHLLMYGPAGTGKTHLGVALYRAACYYGTMGKSAWYHIPSLCDAVKAGFNDRDAGDPFEDLTYANEVVVLDDLFGRQLTPYEIDNVLFRVIDTAHRNSAALIATTNYTLEELSAYLNAHEMSRLLENASVLEFAGQDRRL